MHKYNPLKLEEIRQHFTLLDWDDPHFQNELTLTKEFFSRFTEYNKALIADSLYVLKKNGCLKESAYDFLTKNLNILCESLSLGHAIAFQTARLNEQNKSIQSKQFVFVL